METRHPAVFIVAVNDGGPPAGARAAADTASAPNEPWILLETLDRFTVGETIEVPAGGTDGEDPLIAAKRELLEETGYVGAEWTELGGVWALNGAVRSHETVFLTRGITPVDDDGTVAESTAEEGLGDVVWFPMSHVIQMVRDGRLTDGETVMALMFAAIHLGWVGPPAEQRQASRVVGFARDDESMTAGLAKKLNIKEGPVAVVPAGAVTEPPLAPSPGAIAAPQILIANLNDEPGIAAARLRDTLDLPEGVALGSDPAEAAVVIAFVRMEADIDTIATPALDAAKQGKLAWIVYPKAKQLATDLNRDILARAAELRGATPVRQVSIDETWSALRLKPGGGDTHWSPNS
jgi:8-oxo-dGTP pyrophosphatase MutT (NUDIX family)